jgi:hypothetical protein
MRNQLRCPHGKRKQSSNMARQVGREKESEEGESLVMRLSLRELRGRRGEKEDKGLEYGDGAAWCLEKIIVKLQVASSIPPPPHA